MVSERRTGRYGPDDEWPDPPPRLRTVSAADLGDGPWGSAASPTAVDDVRTLVLLARAQELGAEVLVPATALAQVLRAPARQAPLMRLLGQPRTTTASLDRADASLVGQLLGATDTSDPADAHVVICARRAGHVVVTTDGDDLRRLDPRLELIEV